MGADYLGQSTDRCLNRHCTSLNTGRLLAVVRMVGLDGVGAEKLFGDQGAH